MMFVLLFLFLCANATSVNCDAYPGDYHGFSDLDPSCMVEILTEMDLGDFTKFSLYSNINVTDLTTKGLSRVKCGIYKSVLRTYSRGSWIMKMSSIPFSCYAISILISHEQIAFRNIFLIIMLYNLLTVMMDFIY